MRDEVRRLRKGGMSVKNLCLKFELSTARMYQILAGERSIREKVKKQSLEQKEQRRLMWKKGVSRSCVACPKKFVAHSGMERKCRPCAEKIPEEKSEIGVCCVPGCAVEFTKGLSRKYCVPHSQRLKGISGGRDVVRDLVRMRDNDTCQECGSVWEGGYMRRFDVHHLNDMCGKNSRGYDSVDDMDGLTTLCHRCHMSNHTGEKIKDGIRKMSEDKKLVASFLKERGWTLDRIGKVLDMTQPTVFKYTR